MEIDKIISKTGFSWLQSLTFEFKFLKRCLKSYKNLAKVLEVKCKNNNLVNCTLLVTKSTK